MIRRFSAVLLLVLMACTLVQAKSDSWVEVRTPHFIIVSDAGEKQALRVADQFERMRAVFHTRFPAIRVDAESPITVLAINDEKTFRTLEPEVYLAKNALRLGGLFTRSREKNYVLMQVNAGGEHPYETIYHEYTHFIFSQGGFVLPLWLDEGMAQFYQTVEIHDKDVAIGQPDVGSIELLRSNRQLPLEVLFAVDHSSPYYHEDGKGNIFYAQAWALTHYLEFRARRENADYLSKYVALINENMDPVIAATSAFGDLRKLQKDLASYIEQSRFQYLSSPGKIEIDKAAFTARAITTVQADAVRADFLVYSNRLKDARELATRVVQQAPDNVLAHETLGQLAMREGNWEEAALQFEQAVKLDPENYLDHYMFAVAAFSSPTSDMEQIGDSLRKSVKLKPEFAPALDQLAAYYVRQNENLDEAYKLEAKAVTLDPKSVAYRMNAASLLMRMNHPDVALKALEVAAKLTSDQGQLAAIRTMQEQIRTFMERVKERDAYMSNAKLREADDETTPAKTYVPEPEPPAPTGPKRSAVGTLKEVRCSDPAVMTAILQSGAKSISLHARNYYKIAYSTLDFKPSDSFNPCKDINSMKAKVDYVETSGAEGEILAIELRK